MRTWLALLTALSLIAAACSGGIEESTAAPPSTTAVATTAVTTTTTSASTTTTTTVLAAGEAPGFEPAPCELSGPGILEAECGWLTVPENRSNPNTRMIRLHVAVFRAEAAGAAPDAVVYLAGGPGGPALSDAVPQFDTWLAPVSGNRDVVVFDQRGVGFSQPQLSCPEVMESQLEILASDISNADGLALTLDAYQRCRNRLVQEGVDLAGYTSAESAADVADLRRALGYEEWNLYGGSYGTRLALTVLRDHPDGVRSVILDSVSPPHVDMTVDWARGHDEVLGRFFADCAADPSCAAVFPDLEATFWEAVARYDAAPVTITVEDPFSDATADVYVDGDVVLAGTTSYLNLTEAVPYVPLIMSLVGSGDEQALTMAATAILGNVVLDQFSHGVAASVDCYEKVPFYDPAELAAAIAEAGRMGQALSGRLESAFPDVGDAYFELCEVWDVPAAAQLEDEPVVSNVPALALAGSYDDFTPLSWTSAAVETLTNATMVEFPGFGHGVTKTPGCPQEIARAFLDDPDVRPDTTCVPDGPPSFSTG